MTSHFPLREAGVFSGRMFTHRASSNCYASPMLSELCLTPWRKVFNMSPPYLKLTFTQLSGVTPGRQIELLLLSWPLTANAGSNPSLLRRKININVNARAGSKMCQSEFSYHNKVNNRTAVPRSHLL